MAFSSIRSCSLSEAVSQWESEALVIRRCLKHQYNRIVTLFCSLWEAGALFSMKHTDTHTALGSHAVLGSHTGCSASGTLGAVGVKALAPGPYSDIILAAIGFEPSSFPTRAWSPNPQSNILPHIKQTPNTAHLSKIWRDLYMFIITKMQEKEHFCFLTAIIKCHCLHSTNTGTTPQRSDIEISLLYILLFNLFLSKDPWWPGKQLWSPLHRVWDCFSCIHSAVTTKIYVENIN